MSLDRLKWKMIHWRSSPISKSPMVSASCLQERCCRLLNFLDVFSGKIEIDEDTSTSFIYDNMNTSLVDLTVDHWDDFQDHQWFHHQYERDASLSPCFHFECLLDGTDENPNSIIELNLPALRRHLTNTDHYRLIETMFLNFNLFPQANSSNATSTQQLLAMPISYQIANWTHIQTTEDLVRFQIRVPDVSLSWSVLRRIWHSPDLLSPSNRSTYPVPIGRSRRTMVHGFLIMGAVLWVIGMAMRNAIVTIWHTLHYSWYVRLEYIQITIACYALVAGIREDHPIVIECRRIHSNVRYLHRYCSIYLRLDYHIDHLYVVSVSFSLSFSYRKENRESDVIYVDVHKEIASMRLCSCSACRFFASTVFTYRSA